MALLKLIYLLSLLCVLLKVISIILVSSFAPEVLKDDFTVELLIKATTNGIFPINLMAEMAGQVGNREDQRVWGELTSEATFGQWRMIECCIDYLIQQVGIDFF